MKWEYRVEQLESPIPKDVVDVADTLGDDGWELVNVTAVQKLDGNAIDVWLFFKRQVTTAR